MRKLATFGLVIAFVLAPFVFSSARPQITVRPSVDPIISLHLTSLTLNPAQLVAAEFAPIQFIPAPGANKMNVVVSTTWQYKFGTTPYAITPSGGFDIFYGPTAASVRDTASTAITTGFLDQSASRIQLGMDGALAISISQSQIIPTLDNQVAFVNQPLDIMLLDGISGGDGSVVVTGAWYSRTVN